MSLAVTHKADAAASGASTSLVSSAFTPTDGDFYLAMVAGKKSGYPPTPSLSGCGLTWVEVASRQWSSNYLISVFRAMVTSGSSAGSVTASWGGSSVSNRFISIEEYTGAKNSGVNGVDAVVQSASALGTSSTIAVTLASFEDAVRNATYMAGVRSGATIPTVEGGYTSLYSVVNGVAACQIESLLSEDTSPTMAIIASDWGAIALEIAVQKVTGSVGQAGETDSATVILPQQPGHWPVGLASELDTATSITPRQSNLAPQQITSDIVLTPFVSD